MGTTFFLRVPLLTHPDEEKHPLMRKPAIALAALLAPCALGACSLFDDDARVYEGHYAFGFEINSFAPCATSERWWVVGEEAVLRALIDRTREVNQEDLARAYVRLQGRPSRQGSYGHLDVYEREFELEAVLEVRAARASDCQ